MDILSLKWNFQNIFKKIYESVKNDNEIISREIISVKNLNKNKEIEENNNKIISREIILDKNQLNIELDDVIKSRINNSKPIKVNRKELIIPSTVCQK